MLSCLSVGLNSISLILIIPQTIIMLESVAAFVSTHWLALIAGGINFLWLYLEYKASVWLWPVGIVLPIFYIVVSWEALFLGNIIVNAYYLITSIIGWWMWLRHKNNIEGGESTDQAITHAEPKQIAIHLTLATLLIYPAYLILKGNSSAPLCDAISTIISFVGMIYLSRKQVEHWLCWIVANALSVYIFYNAKDYVSSAIFTINWIVSILGYRHWLAQIRASENTSNN